MPSILELLKTCATRNFKAGEVVLAQGTRTGLLFFLIEGSVEVAIDDVVIATESQAGAVFGDLSALMGIDHTATVRALSPSSFYVVENPRQFIEGSLFVSNFLCGLLAYRLEAINRFLVAVRHQVKPSDPVDMIQFLETLMRRQIPSPRLEPQGLGDTRPSKTEKPSGG